MGSLLKQDKNYSYTKKDYELAAVPESGTEMTKYFEGWRPEIYKDTTGNKTIGYGFKLSSAQQYLPKDVLNGTRELTRAEAEPIFNIMYNEARDRATQYATPELFNQLSPRQQNILIDMSYNLGNNLFDFKKMQKALLQKDFIGVTREMEDSKWYGQVGRRGVYHTNKFVE
jgi:GH24 family phage-related lysozyme (muramidase)